MKNQTCNSLIDLFRMFPDEESCLEYLEKIYWPNGAVSPFDPSSKVIYYGNHRYRCNKTRKYFTVKTGTMFHSIKIPLTTWFVAIWLITTCKKGISSMQLARDLRVIQKTAWHLLHRIRKCYFCENQSKLSNEVELDETFVGEKNKNRHFNKKVKNSQGRSFKDKTPVLGMLEWGGKLVCRVVKSTASKHITTPILKTINKSATLFTDE